MYLEKVFITINFSFVLLFFKTTYDFIKIKDLESERAE